MESRPKALTPKEIAMMQRLNRDPELSVDDICRTLHISRPTFYRYVNDKSE